MSTQESTNNVDLPRLHNLTCFFSYIDSAAALGGQALEQLRDLNSHRRDSELNEEEKLLRKYKAGKEAAIFSDKVLEAHDRRRGPEALGLTNHLNEHFTRWATSDGTTKEAALREE